MASSCGLITTVFCLWYSEVFVAVMHPVGSPVPSAVKHGGEVDYGSTLMFYSCVFVCIHVAEHC